MTDRLATFRLACAARAFTRAAALALEFLLNKVKNLGVSLHEEE